MDVVAKRKVSDEKIELARLLNSFLLRINEGRNKKDEPRWDVTTWAQEMGVDRSLLSQWLSRENNRAPGGASAIRMVNYLLPIFGDEALRIYDLLGWDRPASVSKRR